MGTYILLGIGALLALLILLAFVTNIPAMRRYSKIRGQSRNERPMGVTTTPRVHVTG